MPNYKSIILIIPLFIIGGLLLGQLLFTNNFVGSGIAIDQIEKDINSIENENEHLYNQLAAVTSLSLIEQSAQKSGFIKPAGYLSLISTQLIALK